MSELTIGFSRVGVSSSEQIIVNQGLSFSELIDLLSSTEVGTKDGPYFLRGACEGKRSDGTMDGTSGVLIIDGDSSFNPATGEVDEVSAPVPLQAHNVLQKMGLTHIIYTTHSHMQNGKGNRWRAVIPTSRVYTKDELSVLNTSLHNQMQDLGCSVGHTKESDTFSQPWYLPRTATEDSPFEYYSDMGSAFHVDNVIGSSVDTLPRDVEKAFELLTRQPQPLVIAAFNAVNSLAEVLLRNGYKIGCCRPEKQRWIHPNSTSGSAGLWVSPDGQICFSHNGSDPLCDGKAHDAFDVYRILEHAGDRQAALSAAAANLKWEAPGALPKALLPVEPFDPDLLPEKFKVFALDVSDRMQCPIEYVAVALMASLGGIVGKRCSIYPKQNDNWKVVPNLWAALIGRPSMMKSPAMTAAMTGVSGLIAQAREDYAKDLRSFELAKMVYDAKKDNMKGVIKQLVKDGKSADGVDMPDELISPIEKRYVTNAGSVEMLIKLLEQNPEGIIQSRDELTGWLRSMDNNNSQDARAFYIESWNGAGSSFSYDTVTHGHLYCETGPCVSVMGTVQPGPLSHLIASAENGDVGDDGLLQRFQLMVYPDKAMDWKYQDRKPNVLISDAVEEVFRNVTATSAEFHFEENAQPVFIEWYTDLMSRIRIESHPGIESHMSKYGQLMPALALLIHLAEGGLGPVSQAASIKAVKWCSFLESHARRIYALGKNAGVDAATSLLKKVVEDSLPNPFKTSEVQRKNWSGLDTTIQAKRAIELLEVYGWARVETVQTGGRPSELCYIHPDARKHLKSLDGSTPKALKVPLGALGVATNTSLEEISFL